MTDHWSVTASRAWRWGSSLLARSRVVLHSPSGQVVRLAKAKTDTGVEEGVPRVGGSVTLPEEMSGPRRGGAKVGTRSEHPCALSFLERTCAGIQPG
ncbi:multimeric flavodoxin WrbA [Microbacterium testaceum StLB037]|uniref:Multimeric flavodoxin WrbA n=1 Tax=Microbacterium testaceum (strain StLB037) TaxID=979556 RepID=E8NDM9_MICTS|nr:multimeric flavodoxin WrbA [Microbacterium testaceum StLB037]